MKRRTYAGRWNLERLGKYVCNSQFKIKRKLLRILRVDGLALKEMMDSCNFDDFMDDYDIIHTAVEQDGKALKYAYKRFIDIRATVITAVNSNGMSLKYASSRLRNDHGVVLVAVQNNGDALQFASQSLQDNIIIVNAAIENYGPALDHASLRLQLDDDFIYNAWKQMAVLVQEMNPYRRFVALSSLAREENTWSHRMRVLERDIELMVVFKGWHNLLKERLCNLATVKFHFI